MEEQNCFRAEAQTLFQEVETYQRSGSAKAQTEENLRRRILELQQQQAEKAELELNQEKPATASIAGCRRPVKVNSQSKIPKPRIQCTKNLQSYLPSTPSPNSGPSKALQFLHNFVDCQEQVFGRPLAPKSSNVPQQTTVSSSCTPKK